jgi:hypothetical protein
LRRLFLIAVLASLTASATIGIFIFLVGEFGDTQRNLLLTTLAVGGFSLTGLASTVGAASWWLWLARPIGLATSMVALGLVVLLIWGIVDADNDDLVLKLAGTLVVLALSSAHLSLLGTFRPVNLLVWLWHSGTVLAAVGLAYLIVGAIWGHIDFDDEELYVRWLGVVAILDVLGTIGLFPLSRLVSSPKPSPSRIRKPSKRRQRRLRPSVQSR